MARPENDDVEVREDAEAERAPAIETLTRSEERDAIARAGPRAPVVYASISARGLEELNRPLISLLGSGFVSGLIMMLSVLAQGLLSATLPAFEGREAVTDIGYTLGFLIVILGRLQLFTENTITPVLPLLANPGSGYLRLTGRLWLIVFLANIAGTAAGAFMIVHGGIVTPEQLAAAIEVSTKAIAPAPLETLRYGVVAGFLIAALVWCMPTTRGAEFPMIFFITYVIALGDFAHVIAGAGEGFIAVFAGEASLWFVLGGFIVPAFVGNVLGGTVLFATLAYVQVMEEISADRRKARGLPLHRALKPRAPWFLRQPDGED